MWVGWCEEQRWELLGRRREGSGRAQVGVPQALSSALGLQDTELCCAASAPVAFSALWVAPRVVCQAAARAHC